MSSLEADVDAVLAMDKDVAPTLDDDALSHDDAPRATSTSSER